MRQINYLIKKLFYITENDIEVSEFYLDQYKKLYILYPSDNKLLLCRILIIFNRYKKNIDNDILYYLIFEMLDVYQDKCYRYYNLVDYYNNLYFYYTISLEAAILRNDNSLYNYFLEEMMDYYKFTIDYYAENEMYFEVQLISMMLLRSNFIDLFPIFKEQLRSIIIFNNIIKYI